MRDLAGRVGKFRIVCTACDFHTEYEFEDLESAAKVANAHRAENPEHPDNSILVFARKTSGLLCHGHMRSKRRTAQENRARFGEYRALNFSGFICCEFGRRRH
jgi:hypothetical protein